MTKKIPFLPTKKDSLGYERSLRKVSRMIGTFFDHYDPNDQSSLNQIQDALQRYSGALRDWAISTSWRMLDGVNRSNRAEWYEHADMLGKELTKVIDGTHVGDTLKSLQAEQVELITSLPIDAANRAQEIARKSLISGQRTEDLVKEIMRSGEVSASRATLIARTETAKASSMLTQARAQAVGCTHFVWHCVHDNRTRPSHREMDKRVCEYANPPIVDGQPLIPGQTYNCRCHASPVITV